MRTLKAPGFLRCNEKQFKAQPWLKEKASNNYEVDAYQEPQREEQMPQHLLLLERIKQITVILE